MEFTSAHYLEAAQDRLTDLRLLRREGRYAAAVYAAGVAVESLLRAYRFRESREFDARHDLSTLLRQSPVLDFLGHGEQRHFGAVLGEVWMRWKNDYRYASDSRLRTEFRRIGLRARKGADVPRKHADDISDAAIELVSIGVRRWTSKRR